MVKGIGGPGGVKGTPGNTERTGSPSKPVIIRKRSEDPKAKDTEQASHIASAPSTENLRDNFKKMQAARTLKDGVDKAIKEINGKIPAALVEGGKARSVGAALGHAKNNSQFQKEVLGAIDGPKPSALEHQAPRTVKISA